MSEGEEQQKTPVPIPKELLVEDERLLSLCNAVFTTRVSDAQYLIHDIMSESVEGYSATFDPEDIWPKTIKVHMGPEGARINFEILDPGYTGSGALHHRPVVLVNEKLYKALLEQRAS